jgi:hypothetical protein
MPPFATMISLEKCVAGLYHFHRAGSTGPVFFCLRRGRGLK